MLSKLECKNNIIIIGILKYDLNFEISPNMYDNWNGVVIRLFKILI